MLVAASRCFGNGLWLSFSVSQCFQCFIVFSWQCTFSCCHLMIHSNSTRQIRCHLYSSIWRFCLLMFNKSYLIICFNKGATTHYSSTHKKLIKSTNSHSLISLNPPTWLDLQQKKKSSYCFPSDESNIHYREFSHWYASRVSVWKSLCI